MKIIINGNIKEYYVQTLCLLYFPGAKFSEKNTDENQFIYVDEIQGDTSVTVTVKFDFPDFTVEKSHTIAYDETDGILKSSKIACGKAFLACGKALTGKVPQWGILTGVRPSKLALKFLDSGKNKTEVKNLLNKEYFINHKKSSLVTDIASTEKKIISKLSNNSCSLYISIPFCPSKCRYCSFVSFASTKSLESIDQYIDKLEQELLSIFSIIKDYGLTLSTIYIGGGTPTTLNDSQLKRLLTILNKNLELDKLEEFTVEAGRPDTITLNKLKILNNYNVNRISINPQTLNSEVLDFIGRKHTISEFYDAYNMANKIGFRDINTDLIAGLPYDGFESFSETIDSIVKLDPTNVTVHTLCIKNAADFALHRDEINLPYGKVSKFIDYSQISLKNAGYIPYYIYRQKNTLDNLENVGFCKPGHEGRYNIYMMEEIHSIFGCGAGAVSKFVSKNRNDIKRVFDFKYPTEYLSDLNNIKLDSKIEQFRILFSEDKDE